MVTPGGQLEKMYLIAYEHNEPNEAKVSVDGDEKFIFQVNPESYKRKFGIQYANTAKVPGTTGDAGTYNLTPPETFTVDVLFDNTGVIKAESLLPNAIVNPFSPDQPTDVTPRVEKLKKFCYNFQSDPHRPYFIRLCWGDESGFFFGVATTLEVDFKLFRPDGKPIRAVAHLSLNEAEDRVLSERRRNPASPDITHEKVFKAGDVFSLLSNKVYKKSEYYIDVAKANKLLSFRNIKDGTKLSFPPLK
jgi:hypothetical protein